MMAIPEKIVAQAHNSLRICTSFKLDMSLSSDSSDFFDSLPPLRYGPDVDDDDDDKMAIGFISASSSSLISFPPPSSSDTPRPFFSTNLSLLPHDVDEVDVLITSHSKRNNAQIVRRKISAEAAKDPTNS